ncbi:head maturation protease, ClpP-related [Anaerorhabdus sp.]|uniref:head maturation protease, ClpP-related n=1 Tax=Anaerorhabdus sp. TaxID=1872524 RepID=UPI002B1FFD97|nr:head maturation protease, ClpP-related [Anaerorhabdus sp.]MEA4876020.1 Clp protease ClpP [Anaerorhabdus sp.]
MEKFYAFKQVGNDAELTIFGDITSLRWYESDVSSYDFKKELDEITADNLLVRINSYGGEVGEGLAIYNLLKDYKGNVTTQVEGFACSIASVIFMAGKERVMNKSSLLMVHNAWTGCYGNANDFEKMADDLRKINEPILQAYITNSALTKEEVQDLLDGETWIIPDEALLYGFATKVVDSNVAMNSMEALQFNGLVKKLKMLEKQIEQKNDEPAKDDAGSFLNDFFRL